MRNKEERKREKEKMRSSDGCIYIGERERKERKTTGSALGIAPLPNTSTIFSMSTYK